MSGRETAQMVKELAKKVGFDLCGIGKAVPIGRRAYVQSWLNRGCAGSMAYLHRYLDSRLDPGLIIPDARSTIVVGLLYNQSHPEAPPTDSPNPQHRGRIAMYAWGDDYHKIVKKMLFALADGLREQLTEPFSAKACVDTAPLIERELAAAAGLGWIGKNTMLIHPRLGSNLFLGVLVTTLDLPADEPMKDHCGSCSRCLDACPTGALTCEYQMDASECVSYLTIEHRDAIPERLRNGLGNRIFGCDACQEVCPFNRKAPSTSQDRFAVRPPSPSPLLEDILDWDEEQYRAAVRGSAIKRATLDMLKRNARIALENASRSS